MNDAQKKDIKIVESAMHTLSEHFDTVQIFVTKHDSSTDLGGTGTIQIGCGNWYARDSQIREWLIKNEERARIHVRKEEEEESDEETS